MNVLIFVKSIQKKIERIIQRQKKIEWKKGLQMIFLNGFMTIFHINVFYPKEILNEISIQKKKRKKNNKNNEEIWFFSKFNFKTFYFWFIFIYNLYYKLDNWFYNLISYCCRFNFLFPFDWFIHNKMATNNRSVI